jgi:hypothetical protein
VHDADRRVVVQVGEPLGDVAGDGDQLREVEAAARPAVGRVQAALEAAVAHQR